MPELLEETIGAKLNAVLGYQGGGAIDLAVERGEVVCRAFSIEAYFSREPFHTWRKKGFVRILVQGGKPRDEKLPDVPTIHEVMDKYQTPESGRRLVTAMLAPEEFFRPHYGPPGMRPERVKILREAYKKTMRTLRFAEAKKENLDVTQKQRRGNGRPHQRGYGPAARGHRTDEENAGKIIFRPIEGINMRTRKIIPLLVIGAFFGFSTWVLSAGAQAPFYQGKTIRLI